MLREQSSETERTEHKAICQRSSPDTFDSEFSLNGSSQFIKP